MANRISCDALECKNSLQAGYRNRKKNRWVEVSLPTNLSIYGSDSLDKFQFCSVACAIRTLTSMKV